MSELWEGPDWLPLPKGPPLPAPPDPMAIVMFLAIADAMALEMTEDEARELARKLDDMPRSDSAGELAIRAVGLIVAWENRPVDVSSPDAGR